jgi:hypothetical protein
MMRATNDVMTALLLQRQSRLVARRLADHLSNQQCKIDFFPFS